MNHTQVKSRGANKRRLGMNVNLLRVFDIVQFALSGCTAKSVFFFHLVIALCTIPRQFQFIQVEISEHLSNGINKTRKRKRTRCHRPDVSDEECNLKLGKLLYWHENPRKYSLITVRKPWHLFVCLLVFVVVTFFTNVGFVPPNASKSPRRL